MLSVLKREGEFVKRINEADQSENETKENKEKIMKKEVRKSDKG